MRDPCCTYLHDFVSCILLDQTHSKRRRYARYIHTYFDFGFVAISIVFSAPNRSLLLFIGSVSLPAHISLISSRNLISTSPKYSHENSLLCTQCGHNMCILFILPHELQWLRLMRSFSALPASCLERLRECDVLFFGTASSNPSHSDERRPVRLEKIVAAPGMMTAGRSRG